MAAVTSGDAQPTGDGRADATPDLANVELQSVTSSGSGDGSIVSGPAGAGVVAGGAADPVGDLITE